MEKTGDQMLRNSYIFLPGVGISTEKKIWDDGVVDWKEFLQRDRAGPLKGDRKIASDMVIRNISQRLKERDLKFFSSLFKQKDNWRLWKDFSKNAVFLDIETMGTRRYSPITVVGAYDRREFKALVRGKNLDPENIRDLIKDASMLVTFNGSTFDLPMIEAQYPGTIPEAPHLDLRFLARRCGYSGGLKSVEIQMGMARPDDIQGMSGEDAVRLWKLYERDSNRNALKLLLKYNMEDIINLTPMADELVNLMTKKVKE
jgi:uncharacterized protein YprB with RNaseH-like and TPR domain